MTETQRVDLLSSIANAVKTCRKCRLHKGRVKSVPGDGCPHAAIAFVGEAPGFNEDQQGLPFVGRAGLLLNDLLSSKGLKREEVWIGNIIKCRPPENRDPMVDEIRSCIPYIEKQLETINPKLIVTLGRFAMAHFIKEGTISVNHGKVFKVGQRLILPLYHPAAALRSSEVLAVLKRDFAVIPKALRGEVEVTEINGDSKVFNENQMNLI